MGEDTPKKESPELKSIDEILRERDRLQKVIEEKFKKEVTILFTDICGYTKYMETKGDISGRNMLQRHNDIVMPVIEQHNGVVIKTIGDAVMATFETPLEAIKSAIGIQKGLFEHNRKTEVSNRIHVKIGINTGDVLIDDADVFGDAVNVAARIQSEAVEDEILISGKLYDMVCGSEDILCRYHDTCELKGKAEPIGLYRVVWQDEDVVLSAKPRVRAHEVTPEEKVRAPLKVLQLEITRKENLLRIIASEQSAGEVDTVRHYEETPVSIDEIGIRCREIIETLNKVNREGRITRDVLNNLRKVGQVFHEELFTRNVQAKVKETQADHLILNLDDNLIHVPWELLHDGNQFLSQRFSMGRVVRTRQAIAGRKTRSLARPLKMLILADLKGDLKEAYHEGLQIRDYLNRDKDFINVSLRSEDITPDFIKSKIRNFDLVHFAGHVEYNQQRPGESGWQLTSGIITGQDIMQMVGTTILPALIFSNACQSARTEGWGMEENFQNKIYGLANAFILAGVKHYIGTFWEVLDEPSRRFATEFYKNLLSGMTLGEAVRTARIELIKSYGEETIVWASYLLYGDPTTNYMDQVKQIEAPVAIEEPMPARVPSPEISEREAEPREEVIVVAEKVEPKKTWAWLGIAAGILGLVAVLLWGYPGFLKEDTLKYQTEVLAYYNGGKFKQALDACKALEDKDSQLRLIYLIRGNINLRNGNLDSAGAHYNKALQVNKGSNIQKAEAFIGLGRIASIRKKSEAALGYYRQATDLAPKSSQGYVSQAILLDNGKKYDEALALLETAQKLAPNDAVIAAISNETRKKVALDRDKEKQARVDKLVNELLEGMQSPPRALPSDGWTSVPLTLWIMDFKAQGYSLQEGEEQLLVSGITDQVLQQGRVQVVERALLDKLLQELKLGSSKLMDRRTALSLGKLMAARLILSGKMFYSGPQTQISGRLIETETGRIAAAITESFGSAVPASALTEKVSNNLLEKLAKNYPLRGKIAAIKGEEVVLNIGYNVGVKAGDQFKAVYGDAVLEIISVEPDKSLCRRVSGTGELKKDLRVEII
jgi:class 3 adenylate cyclase/CHAT domain-containing protein/tetratricopeptide (TPR) repeat protein